LTARLRFVQVYTNSGKAVLSSGRALYWDEKFSIFMDTYDPSSRTVPYEWIERVEKLPE
jgi:hypothetical protein